MKKYIMEIMHEQSDLPSGKYKTVVTVDEAGNYYQYNETEDINGEAVRFTEYKKSIFEMGWKSLTDFLKGRMPEYKVIETEEKMKLYLNGYYVGECLGYHQQRDENGNKWIEENNFEFEYRLLSRCKQDCEYYLGYGGRCDKYLWAGNPRDHIAKMRELYNIVPEKPEWLTEEQINEYAERMEL